MDDTRLVAMANQIATFFKSFPEAEAVAATADHIMQFWDPRMRAQLSAYALSGGSGLCAIAQGAAERIARPKVASAS